MSKSLSRQPKRHVKGFWVNAKTIDQLPSVRTAPITKSLAESKRALELDPLDPGISIHTNTMKSSQKF